MHAIRNARAQQSRMLRHAVRTTDAHAFFNLLTDDSTLDQVEVQLPIHRERLLPPTETLAMFLAQALSADRSCQHAVNRFVAGRVAGGLSACSTATGASPSAQTVARGDGSSLGSPDGPINDSRDACDLDVARAAGALGRWQHGVDA